MSENAQKPRIRFKGFSDVWEQRKLGEIVSLRGRIGFRGYTQADLVDAGEGAITFSPADINDAGYISLTENKYISWTKYEESPEIKVQVGDILFTKTASIGKVGFVRELKEKATINPQFALLTPNGKTDGYFTFLSIRTDEFMKKVRDITGGSSVPTMSQERLKELTFMAPSLSEQKNIGGFFANLDHLITLHQRKYDKLVAVKKALLEKMFPADGETVPKIRFKGFSDAWEQRKFDEIAVRSSVICSDANLPRVEYEDIVSGAGRLNKDIFAKQSSKSGIAFHQGDVLYGKLRPYLQNWLLPTFGGLAVGDFWVLQPQNADSSFLYRLIQSRQFDEVANQSTGTKMPRADWKLVSKTMFSIPSNISEQAAIGTYFTALDNLITLHQRQLEKLKNIKSALLEKMFV